MNLSNFANMDPHLLLSLINMKLRDEFESLDDLARYYDIDAQALITRLKTVGFEYQAKQNQFR